MAALALNAAAPGSTELVRIAIVSPNLPASREGHFEAAFAGDQQLLYLRAAVADRTDPVVAVVARHRAVIHVAPAAVNLDREIGALRARLGRVILGHRQFFEIVAPLIDVPCRAIGQEPRGIDLKGDFSDHFLDQLKPAERAAKRLPLPVSYTHLRAHETDSYLV